MVLINYTKNASNNNSYAKYSIKSYFVCDLDLKIMTCGKNGTVLNKTFIYYHSSNHRRRKSFNIGGGGAKPARPT